MVARTSVNTPIIKSKWCAGTTKLVINNPAFAMSCADEESAAVYRFQPPVCVQRYEKTSDVLEDLRWKGNIQKVVEFGSAELRLFPYLKNLKGVTAALHVDLDRVVTKRFQNRVMPLPGNFILERNEPLSVRLLEGNVAEVDYRLKGSDAVVAIELIEHLEPDVLAKFPITVFEYTEPKLVIVTTPNADFNVFFPNLANGGFRHPDHKFEWTRKQFQEWANNIVAKYNNYKVEYYDIGIPRRDDFDRSLGGCSQMALFIHQDYKKKDDIVLPEDAENLYIPPEMESDCMAYYFEKMKITDDKLKCEEAELPKPYKEVLNYNYPYRIDNRTLEKRVFDEARYRINIFAVEDSPLFNETEQCWEIPIDYLMKPLDEDLMVGEEKLSEIMRSYGFKVVNNVLSFYKTPSEDEEEYDQEMYEFGDDENASMPENTQTCPEDPFEDGWDLESR